MKTKIIYISGGEAFEMTQIRAAFDEVRNVLGLDNQTVLFGVPVDCDTALAEDLSLANANTCTIAVSDTEKNTPENIIPEPQPETPEPEIDTENTEQIIADSSDEAETSAELETHDAESDKVIPILSVLASKTVDEAPNITDDATQDAERDTVEQTSVTVADAAEIISDIQIDSELVTPVTEDNTPVEKITIGDMIDEAAPAEPVEKTLEQLLESMTPLREDLGHEHNTETEQFNTWDTENTFAETDTDATLAQLASEFAETEDKIVATPKSETHGKIGKLKNILPFKKAKRDDNSLMGDLFGWAGVAANDDDFSIPGFFTPARKQGS